MADLHPHWQETDDDEQPVAVRIVSDAKSHEAPTVPRAKRGPGAMVGIAMFFAIGFAFAQGIGGLMGQASQQETIVTIGAQRVSPALVTVRAGETVTWENMDDIPHIIQSDTLPTDDGKPYESSAIFPQSTVSYRVPLRAEAGTYDYISTTDEAIAGQIMIVSAAVSQTTSAPSNSAFPQLPAGSGQIDSATGSVFSGEEQNFPSGVIPTNPNTVGSPNANLPPRQRPIAGTAGSVTQHSPTSQPQTGNELLIVIAISVGAFLYCTRKAMRSN